MISALVVLKDANDFKNNFSSSKNLFILGNNQFLAGGELLNQSYKPLSASSLEDLEDSYSKYEFSDIKDEYYKIFVIDPTLLDSLDEINIQELDLSVSGKELREVLESDEPEQQMARLTGTTQFQKTDDFKSIMMSYVISELFNPKNIGILIDGIRNGQIKVYEETSMFKVVKIIPKFFIKDIAGSTMLSIGGEDGH